MHACTHAHTHIPLVQLLWGALTDHNSITKNLPPQSLVQVIRWPSLPSSAFYTGGNETLRNQRLSQMMQRVSRGGGQFGSLLLDITHHLDHNRELAALKTGGVLR